MRIDTCANMFNFDSVVIIFLIYDLCGTMMVLDPLISSEAFRAHFDSRPLDFIVILNPFISHQAFRVYCDDKPLIIIDG